MQPDKPFNYWDNTTPNPAPINPPTPQAQPVSAVPPASSVPIQQPVPAQEPVYAPQPPVALTTQPTPQTDMPVAEIAPAAMYEPEDGPLVDTRQVPAEDTDYYGTDDNDESPEEEVVHWTASEYVQQEKNSVWFIVFAIIVVGLIALDIFLLKSYTFSALIVVMAIALAVLNRRPPGQIDYALSPRQGLYVGEVLHRYDEFRSFGVINDNGNNFIKLIPIKRFSVGVSVYFPTELGEAIVDILGARIPMEDLKLDVVDTVVRKLRL